MFQKFHLIQLIEMKTCLIIELKLNESFLIEAIKNQPLFIRLYINML